jgi:ABC-type antimicrobial peptide transport system permease subunit
MGIRLTEGRSFTEADGPDSSPVVIVDRRLAERTWPGASAVGRRLGVDVFVTGKPDLWATVIGVVEHVRHRSPVEEVREQVYFAQRQAMRNPSLYVIKSNADPATIVPGIRESLKALDPSLPIYDVRPLSAYVDAAFATRAFTTRLAVMFAVIALVLASVGIYGVIAYSVALRHREFGVRRALGAQARQVMGTVVREGLMLLGKGMTAGIAGAVLATWFMRGLLFGVGPWDLATYAAAIPALLLVGAVACLLPARRAMRINPADALRAE